MPPLRVVLDTNAVLPALIFPAAALSWLRSAWQGADLIPLATEDTLAELRRVLGYRKFNYTDPETRAAVLRQYETLVRSRGNPSTAPARPGMSRPRRPQVSGIGPLCPSRRLGHR